MAPSPVSLQSFITWLRKNFRDPRRLATVSAGALASSLLLGFLRRQRLALRDGLLVLLLLLEVVLVDELLGLSQIILVLLYTGGVQP